MEVKVIKRYSSPSEAYIDAGLLRDNDIECEVNGENLVNVMPLSGDVVTLSVLSSDEENALALLSDD